MVTNAGPNVQTSVTVTDTLPVGAVFLSAHSPRGTCAVTNGIVTCNLGILTNATGVELTVQTRIDVEGVFTNRVNVKAIESDSNAANNLAEAVTVLVLPQSRLLKIEEVANTNRVIVSWPASPVNFLLQTTSGLDASNAWRDVPSPPVLIDGLNRVTNDVTDTSRFYRLKGEF